MGGGLLYGVLYITLCVAFGQDDGLFPIVFNLASRARISTNATCGENEPEEFCKLVEHVRLFPEDNRQCDVCYSRSNSPSRRHPISNAIDGSNKWWQSPPLTNGKEFNYVTITLDLSQVYQIAYVILKAANSPRPGNWILERSLDGVIYKPWQYFATTARECRKEYGVKPTHGVPTALGDDEVICTTRYSHLLPLENGEIFVSLVNGRPGINHPSQVLLDFTSARYIRLRFQKIRTLNADLMTFQLRDFRHVDASVTQRYFYSVKDISIGGHCICYGHARLCRRHDTEPDRLTCECEDNTCGDNCERCCPGFNQKSWDNARDGRTHVCEACNCHGKADDCIYNATIAALRLSLNKDGMYDGGGVCQGCREFTTGINCEKCMEGYYRPRGVSAGDRYPCRRCNCQESRTATSLCVSDDSRMDEGLNPGDCLCKAGFTGRGCNQCAFGYFGYPNCRICPCNPAGSLDPEDCRRRCRCKANVEGEHCDRCKAGYYNLDRENPEGCTKCYCHGISSVCKSTVWGLSQVDDMMGWVLSTREPGGLTLLPRMFGDWLEAKTYLLNSGNSGSGGTGSGWPVQQADILYWLAPMMFLGNRLTSYGGKLSYTIKYTLDENLDPRYHLSEPDVIIEGNGITITDGKQFIRELEENRLMVHLHESKWRKVIREGNRERQEPVSKQEFVYILQGLTRIMIRASYHTAQDTVYIKDVRLDSVSPIANSSVTLPSVEQCVCPMGYGGLSCESCAPGYRRLNNTLYNGLCLKCDCYNHAMQCDPVTGNCVDCQHNTAGIRCERCLPGYYGDPRRGSPNDCKRCACPRSPISENGFHECVLRPTRDDPNDYECLTCPEGQSGNHCDRCAPGFYGNPTAEGGSCRPCYCSSNIDMGDPGACDPVTGRCLKCSNNTQGEYCQNCMPGYFGSAVQGNCRACNCHPNGSYSQDCDERTGQCSCKPRYMGRQCGSCQRGYGDVSNNCPRCQCSRVGSLDLRCDPITGQCSCRPGIGGMHCERCREGMYGFSNGRCRDCECFARGTNGSIRCDVNNGQCECHPNVVGQRCDQCENGFWGIQSGRGCLPCDCDRIGATRNQCDIVSGQCSCRTNIGGKNCDRCLPGYYGFNFDGCKKCKPCNLPGHICDPRTGECVCPPNTKGPNCEECTDNTWGYNSTTGCKRCNCSKAGSVSRQCNADNGSCTCLPDYRGYSCNKCLFGFYDFPNCGECMCNTNGTKPSTCKNNTGCQCDRRGRCKCKMNVEGPKCDRCRRNTFSLDRDNPNGCTACYCFGRARVCSQAPYVWTTISAPTMRRNISPRGPHLVENRYGFLVMPENVSEVAVPMTLTDDPLYWSLPEVMLGDKILSYSARLDVFHYFEADDNPRGSTPGSNRGSSPLVVLVGNGYVLTYGTNITLKPENATTLTVRLHENFWRVPGRPNPVSRALLMVVLQDLDAMFVRATNDGYATYASLGPISLQIAEPGSGATTSSGDTALGIELCDCPKKYSGTSCQNPGDGFFREKKNVTYDLGQPEIAIGHIRRCRCNGHSDGCNPETGVCVTCDHNTTGLYCEQCIPGFFGDASRGSPWDCSPCACPREERSNSFSTTCEMTSGTLTCTNCSEGYTGTRCERCLPGYYGNPVKIGDQCKSCDCNSEGSVSNRCDINTGRCDCLPGIEGHKCDTCDAYGYAVQNGTCISCFTGCTGVLLEDLGNLTIPNSLKDITIPLPWDRLRRMMNETEEIKELMRIFKQASLANLGQYANETEFLDNAADRLLKGIELSKERIRRISGDANNMINNATSLEDTIREVFADIKHDIGNLEHLVEKLFNTQSGVNITAAFREAQRILDGILARDFSNRDEDTYDEKKLADKLLRRVQRLKNKNFNASETDKRLSMIIDALHDLGNRSQRAHDISTQFLDKDRLRLARILTDLVEKYGTIHGIRDDTNLLLVDGQYYIDEARNHLDRFRENLLTLDNRYLTLEAITNRLMDIVMDMRNAQPGMEDKFSRASQHARDLARRAAQLDQLFAKTRADSEKPVKAAKAYQEIVKAIEEAEKAAKEALKKSRDTVALVGVDKIKDNVRKSMDKSRKLQRQSNKMSGDRVANLENELIGLQKDVEGADKMNQGTRDKLDMLNEELDRLPKGLNDRLRRVNVDLDNTGRKARRTDRRVDDILDKMRNKLQPAIEKLQGGDVNVNVYDIKQKTQASKDKIGDIRGIIGNVQRQVIHAQLLQHNVSRNLLQLKEKIRLARETANNMKLSLSCDGKCVRTYRSVSQAGATNDITFGLKLNRTQDKMLLMLVQKSKQEFLAVELIDSKIRFTWDNGGGQGSVTYDTVIPVKPPDDPEKEKWYRVSIKRIGRIGLLKVYQVQQSEATTAEAAGTSPAGHSVLKLSQDSDVFFGGVDADFEVPDGISSNNLTGCIGDIKIDGKAVGVYNFKNTSESCDACNEVPQQPISTNEYYFDGRGYAEMQRESYRSDRISLSFEFKTYWENAILHFSGNPDMGDFMSVELREGRVVFQFYNGGMSLGTGTTANTYNNNKWNKVKIDRIKLQALLRVNDETVSIEAKKGNNGLDLKSFPFYFGGVPASLDLTKFKKISNLETTNFLGCMRDVELGGFSTTAQDLFTGSYVGMSGGCQTSGIRKVGFYGDGYSLFNAEGLKEDEDDISISFITKQRDALLVLATDVQDNYYSIALSGGRLVARFATDGQQIFLQSDDTYNDEVLHNVAIVKMGSKLVMLVDDVLVDERRLPSGVDGVPMDPITGRMYIGGVPFGFDVGAKAASDRGLDGCISDIIVNGNLLNLNLPVQYKRADVGRCPYDIDKQLNQLKNESLNGLEGAGPFPPDLFPPDLYPPELFLTTTITLPETTLITASLTTTTRKPKTKRTTIKARSEPVIGSKTTNKDMKKRTEKTTTPKTTPKTTTEKITTMKDVTTMKSLETTTNQEAVPEDTEAPETCALDGIEKNERGAFTFGNIDTSFAQIKFRKREVVKTFNISFDFRTFYADGLFFLLTNPEQTDYLVVQLQSGEVVLSYSHKGQEKNIRSGRRLGDGEWHSVVVNKGTKNIYLKVEKLGRIKERIARRLDIIAPMYVGGLPKNYPNAADNFVPHSIRGCLRDFTVNNNFIDIGDTKVISGVGPCSKHVEPGAYFNGNAWGIYSRTFEIGEFLTISLEFRTNYLDGILMSISSDNGDLGMTLELHQGKVKFTIRNDDATFAAESPNAIMFEICDQKWHKVTAEVIRNVVAVQLDNYEKVHGRSTGNIRTTETDSPLFIGGMPESFPQVAASTSKGFHGCMRNLRINQSKVDWYKLVDIRNIRRTACPLF